MSTGVGTPANTMLNNRHNYDSKILDRFEVIACFFVDKLFNKVYINAKKKYMRNSTSITDEYRQTVDMYVYGITKNEKIYSDTVQELHEYYQMATKFKTISLYEFESVAVGLFVPEEYLRVMNEKAKDRILYDIITYLVQEFCKKILSRDMFSLVIDKRKTPGATRPWLDAFIDICIVKREEMLNKFATQYRKSKDVVPKSLVDKLQSDINRLWEELGKKTRENIEYQTTIARYLKIIAELNKEVEQLHAGKQKSNAFDSENKSSHKTVKRIVANAPHNTHTHTHTQIQSPDLSKEERARIIQERLKERKMKKIEDTVISEITPAEKLTEDSFDDPIDNFNDNIIIGEDKKIENNVENTSDNTNEPHQIEFNDDELRNFFENEENIVDT